MAGRVSRATAFAVDLGITTKLMMRSIMDIARSEGEDLMELDTQLACLQVFALGGKGKHDDSLETGYYASRVAMGSALKGGTKALGGLVAGSSNPILAAVAVIASRFSVQVSEKFVAQAVPILGAAGGASGADHAGRRTRLSRATGATGKPAQHPRRALHAQRARSPHRRPRALCRAGGNRPANRLHHPTHT